MELSVGVKWEGEGRRFPSERVHPGDPWGEHSPLCAGTSGMGVWDSMVDNDVPLGRNKWMKRAMDTRVCFRHARKCYDGGSFVCWREQFVQLLVCGTQDLSSRRQGHDGWKRRNTRNLRWNLVDSLPIGQRKRRNRR